MWRVCFSYIKFCEESIFLTLNLEKCPKKRLTFPPRQTPDSRMFRFPCTRDMRCTLQLVEETSNIYFYSCTFCFFICIIKIIFHLQSLFFMALLCTSLLQKSTSKPALLYDFKSSGCTLTLLGVLKRLIETPYIHIYKSSYILLYLVDTSYKEETSFFFYKWKWNNLGE